MGEYSRQRLARRGPEAGGFLGHQVWLGFYSKENENQCRVEQKNDIF